MSSNLSRHAGERPLCPSPVFYDGGSCEFPSTWSVALGQAAQVTRKAFKAISFVQEQRPHVVMSLVKPDHARDP